LTLALFGEERGTWLRFLAVLAAQGASVSVLFPGRWRLVGLLLGVLAAALTLDQLGGAVAAAAGALVTAAAPAITRRRSAPAVVALLLAAGIGQRSFALSAGHASASVLFPLDEISTAHATARRFVGADYLETHASTLALTTVHVQVSLGYLGVAYVRAAQSRKNQLLLTGGGADGSQPKLPAASFTRSALSFMGTWAMPYLLQRTTFESISSQLELVFRQRLSHALRVHVVLADGAALGAAAGSNLTVEAHCEALDDTVHSMYGPRPRTVPGLSWAMSTACR
jgi:hypothetical protein